MTNSEEENSRFGKLIGGIRKIPINRLMDAWKGVSREVSETVRLRLQGKVTPDLDSKEEKKFITEFMQECLEAEGGEISQRARTMELGKTYLSLNEGGRRNFLNILAGNFGINKESLHKIAARLSNQKIPESEYISIETELREILNTPRQQIMRQFNTLPDGFKFLVDMRADLLGFIGKNDHNMKRLETELKELLAAWFDIGLLTMERITWNSPAALLERLIQYEAVHEIESWDDLKNRLDIDRRCYAFFHGKMSLEPLIFVEVALTDGIASSIQNLLDEESPTVNPEKADTAIFYSISNTQKGLGGISFGNFLIKKVAEQLGRELGNIKNYATLSPIPGFKKWLDKTIAGNSEVPAQILTTEQLGMLNDHKENLLQFINDNIKSDWANEESGLNLLEEAVLKLCAHYLVKEKNSRGSALDPVAHFHLTNGARLERINWLADTSPKGMSQSFGLMVNYLYRMQDISENHEKYSQTSEVTYSRHVRALIHTS